MKRTTLTTSTNPYNPFTQYDMWREWDEILGEHFSSQYLASVAPWNPSLSDAEYEFLVDRAINEIVEADVPIFDPFTGERVHYVRFTEE